MVNPPEIARYVEAARRGDHEAFEQLVRLTYRDTYTLAFRLTGNEEDARDVVQETYLRTYRSIGRFRGDAQFSTWLYRITANCAASVSARSARHRHAELVPETQVLDPRAEHDPVQHADAANLRLNLEAAIAELPPRLRQVIVLRDVYELPHDQIAAELGITESAAKVRLHRARRLLRDRLFSGDQRHAV
jgi:RNA polymerase sigma-70 factor (ECF subfamily)